jgi:hypothetical protein
MWLPSRSRKPAPQPHDWDKNVIISANLTSAIGPVQREHFTAVFFIFLSLIFLSEIPRLALWQEHEGQENGEGQVASPQLPQLISRSTRTCPREPNIRFRIAISVSDGRQPLLAFNLQVSQTAASRSLDALVGPCIAFRGSRTLVCGHGHTSQTLLVGCL